jgi:hypothetical protein
MANKGKYKSWNYWTLIISSLSIVAALTMIYQNLHDVPDKMTDVLKDLVTGGQLVAIGYFSLLGGILLTLKSNLGKRILHTVNNVIAFVMLTFFITFMIRIPLSYSINVKFWIYYGFTLFFILIFALITINLINTIGKVLGVIELTKKDLKKGDTL